MLVLVGSLLAHLELLWGLAIKAFGFLVISIKEPGRKPYLHPNWISYFTHKKQMSWSSFCENMPLFVKRRLLC